MENISALPQGTVLSQHTLELLSAVYLVGIATCLSSLAAVTMYAKKVISSWLWPSAYLWYTFPEVYMMHYSRLHVVHFPCSVLQTLSCDTSHPTIGQHPHRHYSVHNDCAVTPQPKKPYTAISSTRAL
jgi:hypothetical protein